VALPWAAAGAVLLAVVLLVARARHRGPASG
jgi:hypothetical protein